MHQIEVAVWHHFEVSDKMLYMFATTKTLEKVRFFVGFTKPLFGEIFRILSYSQLNGILIFFVNFSTHHFFETHTVEHTSSSLTVLRNQMLEIQLSDVIQIFLSVILIIFATIQNPHFQLTTIGDTDIIQRL